METCTQRFEEPNLNNQQPGKRVCISLDGVKDEADIKDIGEHIRSMHEFCIDELKSPRFACVKASNRAPTLRGLCWASLDCFGVELDFVRIGASISNSSVQVDVEATVSADNDFDLSLINLVLKWNRILFGLVLLLVTQVFKMELDFVWIGASISNSSIQVDVGENRYCYDRRDDVDGIEKDKGLPDSLPILPSNIVQLLDPFSRKVKTKRQLEKPWPSWQEPKELNLGIILELEVCIDTVVGNTMLRGIFGGQRKHVTTDLYIQGRCRLNHINFFSCMKYSPQYVHSQRNQSSHSCSKHQRTYNPFYDIILLLENTYLNFLN
ncbi:ABC transporter G family member 37, partial [Mucuna pruriens]